MTRPDDSSTQPAPARFETTIDSLGSLESPRVEEMVLTGLTLLYHPQFDRIGERAFLPELDAGRSAEISRLVPLFAHPARGPDTDADADADAGGDAGGDAKPEADAERYSDIGPRPLEHRSVSRSPLYLEAAGDGWVLRKGTSATHIVVDDEIVVDSIALDDQRLEQGVVIQLGHRIVVLLHRLRPFGDSASSNLGMIGESAPMVRLRRDLRLAARLDVPVLVRGETGTGKELVAAALHRASERSDRPFVAVNAAAIPPALAAAELFGAARGAYTGATGKREGYLSRANGGTLFLDEVGEMPIEVQTLLLRCLETGEIQPVGDTTHRSVDVRLVTATDADLEAAVANGTFRAPLLHRLAGFRLDLPPLRERRDDIGRLLAAFLREELAAIGQSHRLDADPPWVPARVVARLVAHSWDGNVRELRNTVRRLVVQHHDSEAIHPGLDISTALGLAATPSEPRRKTDGPLPAATPRAAPRGRKPADIAESDLIDALRAARWRPHVAARALGIPRPSIYHLMKKSRRVRIASDLEHAEIEDVWLRLEGDVTAVAAELEVSERALRRRLGELGFSSPRLD